MTDSRETPENIKKKPNLAQVLVPVVVILALVFVTLSFLRRSSERHADESHPASAIGGRPAVGDTLVDLELKPLTGESKKLSDVPAKVRLINIWATWCGPCISEMPSIVKLHEKYKSQGFEVIGINVDEDPTEILRPFEKRFGMQFASYIDPEGKFSDTFGVSSIPFSIVINADRKILFIELGDRDWFTESTQKQMEGWLQGNS